MSQTKTTGVRFDPRTEARLQQGMKLAASMGYSRADIIRYSVKIGLTMLEKVKFDIDAITLAGVHVLIDPPEEHETKSSESSRHSTAGVKRKVV